MIAAIILAHQNPSQLAKLVASLQHSKVHVLIHLDAKANLNEFQRHLAGLSYHMLNPRHDISWGGFEMVRSTLEALKIASQRNADYSHLALLSGSCMPLVASQQLVDFFDANPNTAFIDSMSIDRIPDGKDRHSLRWHRFGNGQFDLIALPYKQTPYGKSLKVLLQFFIKLCLKRKFNSLRLIKNAFKKSPELNHEINIKFGSQWWVLTSESVLNILIFLENNPEYLEHFQHSKIPDESFFQTLVPFLVRKGMNTSIKATLTYTSWSTNAPSPEWLDAMTSYERESLANRGYLFARKFRCNYY
jgi:hypothetical protein